MEGIIFWVAVGAIFAGLITWLALRAQAATLQERLMGRENKIREMESRLTEQTAALSLAQVDVAPVSE